jgi:predicted nucleotidyltransferase
MSTLPKPRSLSETLFSRNRRAILGLLYGRPDEQFYFRQVVRAAGGGHGAIQRELKHLSEAGIIHRDVHNSQVYFQAGADCPIFEELKAIIVKTAGVADVLRTALAALSDRIRVAFVYGSMAAGRQRSESDVDVLVVGDAGFREVVAVLAQAQTQVGREINPTVYPPEEFCAKLSARHHFLGNVLAQEKIFLIGDERDLERLAQQRLAD